MRTATTTPESIVSPATSHIDGEGPDQPSFSQIDQEARRLGLQARYLPVVPGSIGDEHAAAFAALLDELPAPVLSYCRTGKRSATLWALAQAGRQPAPDILASALRAGFDLSGLGSRIGGHGETPAAAREHYDVVIVGAGAAGIATAASLLARQPGMDIALIDPADAHSYQPGWTMVGAGVFDVADTVRPMHSAIPAGVRWIKAAVELRTGSQWRPSWREARADDAAEPGLLQFGQFARLNLRRNRQLRIHFVNLHRFSILAFGGHELRHHRRPARDCVSLNTLY